MKKLVLTFLVLSVLSLTATIQAQYTTADIFKVDKITWYGLDFTNIKLIGSEGFLDPDNIKYTFFNSWNNLVKVEPDKYNLERFFKKKDVDIQLDLVKKRNKTVDPDQLVIDEDYDFHMEKVEEIISEYEVEGEGIGLVFIMESFNKNEAMGYMWVTFFDIKTKKVLLADNMSGKAGGFGMRNYWAKSYFNVMREIEKKKYKMWDAEY
jgi:hypothetical protein